MTLRCLQEASHCSRRYHKSTDWLQVVQRIARHFSEARGEQQCHARINAQSASIELSGKTTKERQESNTAKRRREGEGRAVDEDIVMDDEQYAEPDGCERIPAEAVPVEDKIEKRCNRK